jgi:hypothetical protein
VSTLSAGRQKKKLHPDVYAEQGDGNPEKHR